MKNIVIKQMKVICASVLQGELRFMVREFIIGTGMKMKRRHFSQKIKFKYKRL
jgi:hypothetical protein